VTASTSTSISVSWAAATDNVGVTGYRVLRNGTAVANPTLTSYTFTALTCNTTYTLAVDAFDAAGNHSTATSLSGTTATCPDTTPPTVPGSLANSSSTTTSVSVTWSPSSDNVAVASYGAYRGGTLVATPASTSYTFTGLACGTSYSVGVDAVDAAGNRSAQASISLSTAACAAGDTANVWVDTSGGSCTRQATAGAYVNAQACGDLDAAYQAATAGDLVRIKAGSYGDQTINLKSGAAGPNRVFAPATGETVSFYNVTEEDADYITLQGPMTLHRLDLTATLNAVVDGLTIAYNYTDTIQPVVFIGGKSTGGRTSNGVIIRNTDISGAWDQKNVLIDDNGGNVTNVLLDHDDIHSQKMSDASVHMECLWITDADGVTVRASRVWGCHATGDVIISNSAGGPGATNILFENNIFETAYGVGTDECCNPVAYTVQTGAVPASTWTFQYNLFESPVIWRPGMTVRGNLGAGGSCVSGVTFAYNLWTDIDCGTDSMNPAALNGSQFVNSAGHNWRPSGPLSLLIDRGDPGLYPSADADNNSRPIGAAPDAGPYEYR
jgi:chitodextrinase